MDATQTMGNFFHEISDYAEDILVDLEVNFKKIKFRCSGVIFHDAASFIPSNSIDKIIVNENESNQTNEPKSEEKTKKMDKYPINENIFVQFVDNIGDFTSNNFEKIVCGGGHDTTTNWAEAINCALSLDWNPESKKIIIFVTKSNAPGKLFCGQDNQNDEEQKLITLIEKLTDQGFFFYGVNVIDTTIQNNEGCKKTLKEIQNIYKSHNSNNYFSQELIVPKEKEVLNTLPTGDNSLVDFINDGKRFVEPIIPVF